MSVVSKIESLLPSRVLDAYRMTKKQISYKRQRRLDNRLVEKLRTEDRPIRVIFFASLSSMWKYDSLYQLMAEDDGFAPQIVVCPFMLRGEDFMRNEMNRTYQYFKERNWNVLIGYDAETGVCVDVHALLPDLIFFTDANTHHPNFEITRYRDCLTCYAPYGFNTIPYPWYCTSLFHNQLWQYFIECQENQRLIESLSPIKVDNHIVVGYPMYDIFMQKSKKDPWNGDKRTRIIWAPHSSIGNNCSLVNFSTFLDYSDYMLEMAERLKEQIVIAYKPHPELKSNLYKHHDWGKEKTDAYYARWANGENTMIAEGDYVDLFLTSDALIHDCGSFMVEYLYTKKPCLYLSHEGRIAEMNEIGKKAYETHYHATNSDGIDWFIQDVILCGNDDMRNIRETFFKESLLPPNNMSVAENILCDIKQKLNRI